MLTAALTGDLEWGAWPMPEVRDVVDSTMATLNDLADSGAPEGLVVLAREQRAGRGRHGRQWSSGADQGVWLSVLLRPVDPPLATGLIPLVIGLAVAEAIEQATGVTPSLKWPNDIVVAQPASHPGQYEWLKLAGILAERRVDGAIIVGLGINVTHSLAELPAGGTSIAASTAAGRVASRVASRVVGPENVIQIAAACLSAIASAYRRWSQGVWSIEPYRARCITLGARVQVQYLPTGRGSLAGLGSELWAVDVDDHGHLIVSDEHGRQFPVMAGDVTLTPRNEPDSTG